MLSELSIAGFGGQGVMLIGQLISYAGMFEDKNVSWIPSYGPEMRGGTANCSVVISSDEIGSPIVTEPDTLIAMNGPSMDKFEAIVKPGGTIIYNSSLIDHAPTRTDVRVIAVPANELAAELGNNKVANMIILGAFLGASGVVTVDSVVEALKKTLSAKRQDLIPLNKMAIEKGIELAK